MEIARYFAMTADEFTQAANLPGKKAWMACHFSPYSTSLSNLPSHLPEGSLLMLNDSTPPSKQVAESIRKTLESAIKTNKCAGLLLDFQRSGNPKTAEIIAALLEMDCQVCVSECYAKDFDCPIFLPPTPLTIPLCEYILPYQNRQIWLDTALTCERINVTSSGSIAKPFAATEDYPFQDVRLHCHYNIRVTDESIEFILKRTKADLEALIQEAASLGIAAIVGLYQELK